MDETRKPIVQGGVRYGDDLTVLEWVSRQVPVLMGRAPANTVSALGVERRGQLVAGVVFHNYRPGIDIEVTLAATDASWAFPSTLRRLFTYPFVQLGVPRMTCVIGRKNKRCRRFSEGIGWKLEGVSWKNYDGVQDAMLYRLTPELLKVKARNG